QRDARPGAEIDLAGEHRHAAVGVDGEKRVDLIRRDRFAEKAIGVGNALGDRGQWPVTERDADDEHAAGLEKGAPLHDRPPAARITARITRAWLPHRHRLPASASRTCVSLGRRVWLRSARAVMTMPAVQ